MKVVLYYVTHTFINAIKKLFKTWVAAFIGIVIVCGLIGGIVGGVIGSVVDDNTDDSSVTETIDEELPATAADKEIPTQEIIEMAIGGLALLIILANIYTGDKSGAAIFTMPDVNFLFPSPMQPQSILMFRTVLQMGIALISSLYLLFQLPNLVFNAGLSVYTALLLLLDWFFILFLAKLAAVCTYTITATHTQLRKFVRPFVIGVVVLLFAAFMGTRYFTGKGLFDTAVLLFASPGGRLIPVFGWLRGLPLYSAEGNSLYSLFCLGGLLAACILLAVIIWKIKADFYEDALSKAAETQATLETAKSGGMAQRKKARSEKLERNGELSGEGAKLFFTKTLYNRRRFAKFGLLTSTCGTYTLLGVLISVFCLRIIGVNYFEIIGITFLIAVYFRNLGNPAADETGHNFLYLVPESPYKKIFYVLLGGTVNAALDLIPALIISALIFGTNFLMVIPWYLLMISLEFFCSSTGLFIEVIIPAAVVPTIKNMLQMMVRMFAIVPGLLILVFGIATAHSLLAVFITFIVNLAVSALLFAITPGFLHLGKS